uniref:Uncharacterized protein n=1 Tax=Oryza brachyantha TaxID=4533 RepID=J3LWK9_ORYBR
MEADMMSMLIDLSRHSPHLLGSLDLAAVAADTDRYARTPPYRSIAIAIAAGGGSVEGAVV